MKVLLIRLRLIGDVVFTTPIPRALKRAFTNARIAYLVVYTAGLKYVRTGVWFLGMVGELMILSQLF